MSLLETNNVMRQLRIEKVTVNCSVGESGAKLERAAKILESLTGQRPQTRKAKKTVKGFGIHKGEPIALRVTLRRQKAIEFLTKVLKAVNNTLKASSFDSNGNFSFGIKEHLDIPGTKYDPALGTIGMDVCVHISRPGLRVSLRRRAKSNVGKSHRITPEETMEYVKQVFNVKIAGEEYEA
ncbi:MAG: 50S ribosomal protein L5 [Nitrososphaerota archaeon]